MGGQEGSDPKSPVRGLELNAMGTRESAGILCRGVTRVDSEWGAGNHPVESWASEPGLRENLNPASYQLCDLGKVTQHPQSLSFPLWWRLKELARGKL